MKIVKVFLIIVLFIGIFSYSVYANPIKATVMNVNKEHNFIVLNKGREEGLTNGLKLKLYKNDSYIGTIEVIRAKEGVAAVDVRSIEDVSISPKDELVLRYGESGTGVEASYKPYREQKKSTSTVSVSPTDVEREISKTKKGSKKGESSKARKDRQSQEKTPIALKPFKKMKDWTVSAGQEVKSWFSGEKGMRETSEIKMGQESEKFGEAQISKVPAVKFVKLETDIKASRRSVLFLINEELKNRGFIVTNYSLIEGMINAQKPMELSTFKEIFANMDSSIDHKIIYSVRVSKIDANNTKVTLDISATYKKADEYKKMKVNKNSKIVNEARDILKEVKNSSG